MEQNNREEEIAGLVSKVLADYDGGRNIDATDIFNKPDRNEVIDIINNLFYVVFPGYFKDRTFKIYNPKNAIAAMVEDIFYHLNKQIMLALDFCKLRGSMSEDARKEESYQPLTATLPQGALKRSYWHIPDLLRSRHTDSPMNFIF